MHRPANGGDVHGPDRSGQVPDPAAVPADGCRWLRRGRRGLHEDSTTQKTGELRLDSDIPMSKISSDDEVFLAPEMNAFGRQFRFLFSQEII